MILASGPRIELIDLPSRISGTEPPKPGSPQGSTLEEIEIEHIRRILNETNTIEEAAEKLGIDASTLYRKRKKYGI